MSLSDIFRRFRRNTAMVLGSRMVFGLLNLATNIVVIRAFGLTELGIVLLLQGYVRLFAGVVKFESWQTILRYGAVAQETDDTRALRRLFGFTIGVDLVAMCTAILAAIICAPFAAELFEWPEKVADFAPYFVISLFFITQGTANGILRLFDRVDTLAVQFALNSGLRFLGVALTALAGGGVMHIVLAWFVGSVVSGGWLFTVCFNEMRRHGTLPVFRTNWLRAGVEFPRIWRFLMMTNLTGMISLIINQGTTMFIGAAMDAAAVATYEMARRFSVALWRPTRLLGPLIFPEIAKLVAQKDWLLIRRLLLKQLTYTALMLAAISLVLFPIMPYLVDVLFGAEFADDIWLFWLLIAGVFISVLGFALEPTMLSANKPGTAFLINAASVAVYVLIAAITFKPLGLTGLALGMLAYYIVFQVLFITFNMRLLSKRHTKAEARKGS